MKVSVFRNLAVGLASLIAIAACFFISPVQAWGQSSRSMFGEDDYLVVIHFVDGNKLLNYCNHSYPQATGYVMGVFDGVNDHQEHQAFVKDSYHRDFFRDCLEEMKVNTSKNCFRPRFCTPENMDSRQATDIVCKWLRENPEKRHNSAFDLAVNALGEAFPCSEWPDYEDAWNRKLELMEEEGSRRSKERLKQIREDAERAKEGDTPPP